MELLFNNFAQGEQCVLKKAEETGELEEKYPATQYRVYIHPVLQFSSVEINFNGSYRSIGCKLHRPL